MSKKTLIKALMIIKETDPTTYRVLDQLTDFVFEQEKLIHNLRRDMKRFAKLQMMHGGE